MFAFLTSEHESFLQQVDNWLRDVGGAGYQAQDPGQRRSQGAPGKSEKEGERGKQEKRGPLSQNLDVLGERGDPAGTRDPEPPPVTLENGATRMAADLI